jgi:hypothetical protein
MSHEIDVPEWALDGESIQDGDELGELINAINLVNAAIKGPEAYAEHQTAAARFAKWCDDMDDIDDAHQLRLASRLN